MRRAQGRLGCGMSVIITCASGRAVAECPLDTLETVDSSSLKRRRRGYPHILSPLVGEVTFLGHAPTNTNSSLSTLTEWTCPSGQARSDLRGLKAWNMHRHNPLMRRQAISKGVPRTAGIAAHNGGMSSSKSRLPDEPDAGRAVRLGSISVFRQQARRYAQRVDLALQLLQVTLFFPQYLVDFLYRGPPVWGISAITLPRAVLKSRRAAVEVSQRPFCTRKSISRSLMQAVGRASY
jgi:hypothetical protein